MRVCYLEKAGKAYRIAFDQYGMLDTVACGGKLLSTKSAVVKSILAQQDEIYRGQIPKGFKQAECY